MKKKTLLACLAVLAVSGLTLLPLVAGSARDSRTVVLVVEDMAFYLEGHPDDPNPRLVFESGERVHLVLKNKEAGVTHDFAVPSWKVRTEAVEGIGSASLDLVVPIGREQYDYTCTPHAKMMRGSLLVQ